MKQETLIICKPFNSHFPLFRISRTLRIIITITIVILIRTKINFRGLNSFQRSFKFVLNQQILVRHSNRRIKDNNFSFLCSSSSKIRHKPRRKWLFQSDRMVISLQMHLGNTLIRQVRQLIPFKVKWQPKKCMRTRSKRFPFKYHIYRLLRRFRCRFLRSIDRLRLPREAVPILRDQLAAIMRYNKRK